MTAHARLQALESAGAIAPIDARFAEAMLRLEPDAAHAELVALAVALASRAVQRGHVCADLAALAREVLLDGDGVPVCEATFELEAVMHALEASALVRRAGDVHKTPLVLRGARLYLERYFAYEERLVAALRERAGSRAEVDEGRLSAGLARLFGADADEQRSAAELAVRRRLAVITGGPGTGKTTTVAKILALCAEQDASGGTPEARRGATLLLAPTGKAAQRLGESLRASLARLAADGLLAAPLLPPEPMTIHRALGVHFRAPTRFRHDAHHPLGADLVLADEASMIDLALMTKLCEAVPPSARLILLGDEHQLASVEAGAVLADACDAPVLRPCIARLTKSYRFDAASRIAALARAIVEGDAGRAITLLRRDADMPYGEIALHDAGVIAERLAFAIMRGFGSYLETRDPAERLARLGEFRLLCVHRRGPMGSLAMNEIAERLLRERGKLHGDAIFYDGRPIMITANDPQLGLSNGDVGVICDDDKRRRAYFPGKGGARAVPLGRLPDHETVFAMTVHKAQGSEMDRVALLLPPEPSPILTRELLYTAVTRARRHVDVFGSEDVLRAGIARRIERASGLRERLAEEA